MTVNTPKDPIDGVTEWINEETGIKYRHNNNKNPPPRSIYYFKQHKYIVNRDESVSYTHLTLPTN